MLAWGGGFDRPDEMHFEIVGTPDEVADVAARLAAGSSRPTGYGDGGRLTHA